MRLLLVVIAVGLFSCSSETVAPENHRPIILTESDLPNVSVVESFLNSLVVLKEVEPDGFNYLVASRYFVPDGSLALTDLMESLGRATVWSAEGGGHHRSFRSQGDSRGPELEVAEIYAQFAKDLVEEGLNLVQVEEAIARKERCTTSIGMSEPRGLAELKARDIEFRDSLKRLYPGSIFTADLEPIEC